MKLAIVHDYIKEYGGAERVLEALHEVWPEAPVYTSVYLPEFLGPHKERFKNWDIRTSFLQKFPLKAKLISPFRMLSSFVFESFDLGEFDAVIVSSTGAYISNLLVLPTKTLHFCYCHTPPRYLYGLKTARDYQNNWFMKGITSIMTHFLRQTDFVAAQRPDFFIANSLNTKRRIEKFYRREAEVLYPPVENSKVKSQKSKVQVKSQKSEYYLTGGRLAQAKGTDLVIKTFNKLGLPLKVFGRGFYSDIKHDNKVEYSFKNSWKVSPDGDNGSISSTTIRSYEHSVDGEYGTLVEPGAHYGYGY